MLSHRRIWPLFYWTPTVAVIFNYFYGIDVCSGRSMQPTLNPDTSAQRDIAIFNKLLAKDSYRRGDIVSIRSPENPRRRIVKRIIATNGDIVKTLPPYPSSQVRIPQGHVWVEGDEHFHSDDSNRFGPIPLALVESRLLFIIWPIHRFGSLYTHSTSDWCHPRVVAASSQ